MTTQPQNLGPGNIWFVVAFVLIMMVVAALVSAAADRMGHRAARRKLRIGKLRPRHVSTLIAVVSGVVISMVTVGLLFLVWHDFYNALTQYDNLNGRLAAVQQETAQAVKEKDEAQQATTQAKADLETARAQITSQSIEIRQKVGQIAETRNKLAGATNELRSNRAKLNEVLARRDVAKRELDRAIRAADEARRNQESSEFAVTQKQELVARAQQEFEKLDLQVSSLRTEIERLQTGTRVLAVGQQLGYIRVQAGSGLEDALQNKLAEIKADIESQGLEFDPGSRDKVVDFINGFPSDGGDYLVRIVSAENVFEGDRVLLDFAYDKLSTLVPDGTAVLDITIYDDHAVISGLGGVRRTVNIDTELTGNSLVNFMVEAESVFQRGARVAGFVAGSDGTVPSPVARLTEVADKLATGQRPLKIQFVSKSSATALEGDVLAGAELHVTSLPRPTPKSAAPQPEADEQAAPDEQPHEPGTGGENPPAESEGSNPG